MKKSNPTPMPIDPRDRKKGAPAQQNKRMKPAPAARPKRGK